MKKILALLLSLVMVLSLAACGESEAPKGEANVETELITSNIDKKSLAKTGAISAGTMLIGSFVAPTVGLVEGVVSNKEGNRAKSAVVGAYERTPLSYANKGQEMEFKQGQVFVMSFKLKGEEENLPNYSYEMVE